MKYMYFSFLTVATFLVVSCTSSTQVEENNEVTIQSAKPVFSTSENVQFSLTNSSSEILHLNYCGPTLIYNLETKSQNSLESYAGGICLALYSPEFIPILQPGETRVIELDSLNSGSYRYNLGYTFSTSESQPEKVTAEFSVQ